MQKKIVLYFPANVVEQPFIYHLIKDYNWMVSLLKAAHQPRKEGRMVLEVTSRRRGL
jgi:L-aspartate semialdehyde sulfurtransferase ferredoxin